MSRKAIRTDEVIRIPEAGIASKTRWSPEQIESYLMSTYGTMNPDPTVGSKMDTTHYVPPQRKRGARA